MQLSAMPVVRPRAIRFFLGLAALMLLVVAVGFGPSLYMRRFLGTVDRFGPSLPPYLLAHGGVLTVWYVLFVVQTLLVRTGRRDIHRRLGVVGATVSVAVVASSLITMRELVARVGAGGAELPAACRVRCRQRLLGAGHLHAVRGCGGSFQAPSRDSQATHAARVGLPPWPRVGHRTSDRSHTAASLAERTAPLDGFHFAQYRYIDLLRRCHEEANRASDTVGKRRDRRGLCGDADNGSQCLWFSLRTLLGWSRRLTGVASLHTRRVANSVAAPFRIDSDVRVVLQHPPRQITAYRLEMVTRGRAPAAADGADARRCHDGSG